MKLCSTSVGNTKSWGLGRKEYSHHDLSRQFQILGLVAAGGH